MVSLWNYTEKIDKQLYKSFVTMLLDHLEEVIPYTCIDALKTVYIAKLLL